MKQFSGEYPADWAEIAFQVKEAANWRCVRCESESAPGHILTVHHLDGNKSNNAWWNLAALCQACHLSIQGRVILEQGWMFEHSNWFLPYVCGYYAHQAGLPEDEAYVRSHIQELMVVGQPWLANLLDKGAEFRTDEP